MKINISGQSTSGGSSYSTIEDEATPLTQRTTINFTGAGVTATDSGGKTVVTIPGGSGAITGQSTLDFGFSSGQEGDMATTTVSAASVTTSSIILLTVSCQDTADHTGEDAAIEEISAYVSNIVNGVSFDIVAAAPNNTWGRYLVNYALF